MEEAQTSDRTQRSEDALVRVVSIHFPGMNGLNIPTVFVFPRVLVCTDCGLAAFTARDAELKSLKTRDWRDRPEGASV